MATSGLMEAKTFDTFKNNVKNSYNAVKGLVQAPATKKVAYTAAGAGAIYGAYKTLAHSRLNQAAAVVALGGFTYWYGKSMWLASKALTTGHKVADYAEDRAAQILKDYYVVLAILESISCEQHDLLEKISAQQTVFINTRHSDANARLTELVEEFNKFNTKQRILNLVATHTKTINDFGEFVGSVGKSIDVGAKFTDRLTELLELIGTYKNTKSMPRGIESATLTIALNELYDGSYIYAPWATKYGSRELFEKVSQFYSLSENIKQQITSPAAALQNAAQVVVSLNDIIDHCEKLLDLHKKQLAEVKPLLRFC